MHTAFTIGVAVMLQTIVTSWWAKYKGRQAGKPQTMKLRGGVYVPWGPVQKVEAFLRWEFRFGIALLGFWVLTCAPDCYHSEVESGSFMMVC